MAFFTSFSGTKSYYLRNFLMQWPGRNVADNNLEGPIPEDLSSCENLNDLNVLFLSFTINAYTYIYLKL